jgi:hypothetical protein
MKVWFGYGSEHSANLVMIGKFKAASDAAKAKQSIDWLAQQVQADVDAKLINIGEQNDHFTKGMIELLSKLKIYSLGPAELEQFAYEIQVELNDNKLILRTDEVDVSAFFKVMFDSDARIEIYSAHTNSENEINVKE